MSATPDHPAVHHHPWRVAVSGTVAVPLPIGEAFLLFTARGEKRWARGWDPRFPANDHDDTVPGTTFVTEHEGVSTVWVVATVRAPHEISYARVTPGDKAGLVTVRLAASDDGNTRATVTYDLTAFTADGCSALEHFRTGYDEFLAGWGEAIRAALP